MQLNTKTISYSKMTVISIAKGFLTFSQSFIVQ